MFYFLRDLSLMLIPDDERNATQQKHNQGGAAGTQKIANRQRKAGYPTLQPAKTSTGVWAKEYLLHAGRVVAVREGSSAIFNFNWRQAIQRDYSSGCSCTIWSLNNMKKKMPIMKPKARAPINIGIVNVISGYSFTIGKLLLFHYENQLRL